MNGRDTDALRGLVGLLREQGGLLAQLLADDPAPARQPADRPDLSEQNQLAPPGPTASGPVAGPAASGSRAAQEHRDRPGPAQLAASGPRAARARAEYELLVEAIYEGYLLHHGAPRVIAQADPDLRLLAGDRLYALGLERLVALGDGEAVAELADTITLSSLAQAAGEPELAGVVWEAGAHAVGWGCSDAHRHAKQLARTGSAEAFEAMRTSAEDHPASP